MSGDAKRFRQLHGSAGRHGDAFWTEEKDNVGLKLLKQMGWSSGQGLGKEGQGRVDAVKQKRKNDNKGIGAKADTKDEAFRASQELFNDVLARLSAAGTGAGAGAAAPPAPDPAALGSAATSIKGVLARRQMTRRFCRSKAPESLSAMEEILGKRKTAGGDGADAGDEPERPSELQQTTSSISVAEHFAQRRKALGLSAPAPARGGGVGASSGFTLDDQADFAESQMARAYGQRRGLGLGGGDDDDDDDEAAKWARHQASFAKPSQAAAVPPPPAAPAARAPATSAASFNWKRAIKAELQGAEGGVLRLKRLRKAVLAAHAAHGGRTEEEGEPKKVFKKRLKKTKGVTLTGKMVKLEA